ncbi:Sua5/YciO/YrdC/YwlC family protein [Roseivirga sp. BDSF3-8]|uniref:Sua5/YciO/YrdC/YwlC family protein n=1 Tax=Roseivirga sp. BDSF3-8 TaxID=3241598 RepID=UPI003531FA0B
MSQQNVTDGSSLRALVHKDESDPMACIGLVSDLEALQKATALIGRHAEAVILIHDITQLYDYVARIPEIAWDLMEFAEKPLTLIMGEGKNVPENLLRDGGEIAITLVKEPVLLKHLKGKRHAHFYLPLDDQVQNEEILSPIDNVIILQQKYLSSSQAKTARLGLDGSIKFI